MTSGCCRAYVERIPYAHPDNWPTRVAGHPLGAVLMFVGLVALGLGSELATASVVTGWRRGGLVLQVVTALVVQHLLYTSW